MIDPDGPYTICPDCGYKHAYLHLPLLIISGVSGMGTTNIIANNAEMENPRHDKGGNLANNTIRLNLVSMLRKYHYWSSDISCASALRFIIG